MIESLLTVYCEKQFGRRIEQGLIVCRGGAKYRYYMVFQNKISGLDGAYDFDTFVDLMKGL